jgi:hypothetical protein
LLLTAGDPFDVLTSFRQQLKTSWRVLRRIPVFRHECALMDIEAQNTVTICWIRRDSTTYSDFSSRMCTDGYWSPEHCDDLLNSSRFGPQRYDILADSSRSTNNK